MWQSSDMFLKKLITNLCLFPRSSTSSLSSAGTNNKTKPPCSVPPSFTTHLSRHFSTQPVHNDPSDPLEIKQTAGKKILNIAESNLYTLDASISNSTTPDDEDVFFTSSSNHSDHLRSISDHHHNNNQQQQQPDFATAFASQRFFFSSPGHSKSLIQLHNHSTTTPEQENIKTNNRSPLLLSAGGVPVQKYSPDPYWDFRKSMQEMVEARSKEEEEAGENWEYLHQLLTCYLTLNPINTHECIIKAFSDLLVTFLLDKQADKDCSTGSPRWVDDGLPR